MEAASGVITLANLLLCLIVGARLLRHAARGRDLPALSLGGYFVASAFLASIPQIVAYGSLGQDSFSLSETTIRLCLAAAVALMGVGAVGIFAFTWRTFRSSSRWAASLTAAASIALVSGYALEALTDGFRLMVLPGVGHWIGWAVRTGAMLWVAIESFRYYAQQRRRLKLGLADPVIANRFLLWAIWSTTAFMNLAADLVARVVYIAIAGTATEVVVEVVKPIVLVTITTTSLLGVVSAVTLFLTFFSPAGYRQWLRGLRNAGTTG